MMKNLKKFLFPDVNRKFVLRVSIVALATYVVFGHVITPTYIKGKSMEPTYHTGGLNLCFKGRYWFSEPKRFDVVMVKLAGVKTMFLKRVIAFEGETFELRGGVIYINDQPLDEPYVKLSGGEWNREKMTIAPGDVYVVGDNRSVTWEQARCGATEVHRIAGGPVW